MKGEVNDGGPAFPVIETVRERKVGEADRIRDVQHQGVSLRAAAALAVLPSVLWWGTTHGTHMRSEKEAAKLAVAYADALLEALDA